MYFSLKALDKLRVSDLWKKVEIIEEEIWEELKEERKSFSEEAYGKSY